MSIEILEDEVKRKFNQGQSGASGGRSIHEHAANMLLFQHVPKDPGKKDENGDPIFENETDVNGRTELPSPAGMTTLETYVPAYERAFPFRKNKSHLRELPQIYKVNMISKDRKGRAEFVTVAGAAAFNSAQSGDQANILKEVQTS